jgi:tetratricopeptide (TPR) repeat protein
MSMPAGAEIQRWSAEVARDPGSPVFVDLARAYRQQGQHGAAMRVCLRGLERNPAHIDGHTFLARLYLEAGDRERARDEWGVVLSLDAENFEARRGMGFVALQQGDLAAARRHLEQAGRLRPDDRAVREALTVLAARESSAAPAAAERPAPPPAAAATPAGRLDPARIFEPLEAETPFLGALLLDAQGLVLAGRFMAEDEQDVEMLGAILGSALEEAGRAAGHLALGGWRGLNLETDSATVHLAPLLDAVLVLAARRGTPAGWVRRTATRAAELARRFLEVTA